MEKERRKGKKASEPAHIASASINVKPKGGGPKYMWGIDLEVFRRIFGAGNTWSNQIKYPQVFHQFILKMSSEK